MRGGTYNGAFNSRLTGTAGIVMLGKPSVGLNTQFYHVAAPIIVKSFPGEWAVIDGKGTTNSS
jgi:hypothetical protein